MSRAFVVVVLAVALAGCPGKRGDVTIGVVGPLTGPLAAIGQAQKRGAEIAAEELNDAGGIGGRHVRLDVRDDADRSRLLGILRDLTRRAKVASIIGPEIATPLLGAGSPAARARVPVLLTAAPLGSLHSGVWRLTPGAAAQADLLGDWLVRVRLLKTVAIARAATAEAREATAMLKARIEQSGGRVVAEKEIAADAPDQSVVVRSLRATNASALAIWTSPADAARILIAASRIGWRPQVCGPLDLFQADFRSLSGRLSDNAMIPLPYRTDWFSAPVVRFFESYLNRYGLAPIPKQRTLVPELPLVALAAYDAVMMTAAATRKNGKDVGGGLRALGEFKGIGGRYDLTRPESVGTLYAARFFNFATIYDADPRSKRDEQVAFYKIQVAGLYVRPEALQAGKGADLAQRILEDILTNPEKVEFFTPYRPPRPPPGPL